MQICLDVYDYMRHLFVKLYEHAHHSNYTIVKSNFRGEGNDIFLRVNFFSGLNKSGELFS